MKRLTMTLAAALVALALPAGAQTGDIFHSGGGTSYNNPLSTLVILGSGDVETQNLTIEALEWPATVTFGVGGQSGCARSGGYWQDGRWNPAPKIRLVGFHNASGKYTGGRPIATACRHWAEGKWVPAIGIFTVRIWSKVCRTSSSNVQQCWDLKKAPPNRAFFSVVRLGGYRATFGPGTNCGPARTFEGLESLPPYAAWCDFTVNIR